MALQPIQCDQKSNLIVAAGQWETRVWGGSPFHATRLSSRPQVENRQILPEQTEQAILPSSQIVRTTSSREQTTDILKKTHEKDDTEMTEENQKTKPHKKDRQTKYDEENEENQ